jgi:hypothetical protein
MVDVAWVLFIGNSDVHVWWNLGRRCDGQGCVMRLEKGAAVIVVGGGLRESEKSRCWRYIERTIAQTLAEWMYNFSRIKVCTSYRDRGG